MTRDEFNNLSIGHRLRLRMGEIVQLKRVSQQTGMITFEYLEMPKPLAPDAVPRAPVVTPLWGSPSQLPGNVNHRAYGLPGAPVGMAAAVEAECQQYGKTPTLVTCHWGEIMTAELIPELSSKR
jgi:hypothetical protein